MSNNKLIRIMQTIIVVLVGCVSPSFAQTLFIEKPKRCKDCYYYKCGSSFCGEHKAVCEDYQRKWWKIGRAK